jgi:hypothetical protein
MSDNNSVNTSANLRSEIEKLNLEELLNSSDEDSEKQLEKFKNDLDEYERKYAELSDEERTNDDGESVNTMLTNLKADLDKKKGEGEAAPADGKEKQHQQHQQQHQQTDKKKTKKEQQKQKKT